MLARVGRGEDGQNRSRTARDAFEKVFERLETNPEKEGGTGLGLAIVKEVVEAHGGLVTVDSKLEEGTTFRFTLPGKAP